jgi:hypothetical protein
VLSIVLARVLWAGILTVRAAVWTANYPRNVLARITGRIVIVSSIAVATSAALVGWALGGARGGCALAVRRRGAGLLGAWLYRAMRVRREFQLLAAEGASGARSEPFSLAMLSLILKEDPQYREYMLWMGIFGAGNLMLTAQLVLLFSEQLHISSGTQIGLLAVVPLITQPLFMPVWARLFAGWHVVRYRARQGCALVLASFVLAAGVFAASLPVLWIGAVLLGAAQAGANLGWNLGHNDFASVGRAQHYMGVHVTLTGLRGGVAPGGRARLHGTGGLARRPWALRPRAAAGDDRGRGDGLQPHAPRARRIDTGNRQQAYGKAQGHRPARVLARGGRWGQAGALARHAARGGLHGGRLHPSADRGGLDLGQRHPLQHAYWGTGTRGGGGR